LWHVKDAALSPDGQLLLLTSVFESKGSTVLKLADLSQRPLPTKCPASTFAWSPTGDQVAVVEACDSSAAGATLEVRSLTDTSAVRVLLTGAVGNASWSADGRKIAVARKATAGPSEIVVVDAAGGAPKTFTRGRDPAWSPSGESIAYLAVDSGGKEFHEIRIMNKNGSRDRRLTMIGAAHAQRHSLSGPLVWSRNSAEIAVALAEELWIVNALDSSAAPVRVQ
jgi:Tol biopolymer transport system component